MFDPKLSALFVDNYREAWRTGKRLRGSLNRLAEIMPLGVDRLDALDEETIDRLDAFRVRFADLQDIIGARLFRSLLALEEEPVTTVLDSLNQMCKRRIVEDFDEWKLLREVRNAFSHDYPERERERVEALNQAFVMAPQLLDVLCRIKTYAEDRVGLDLSEFEPL